MNGTLRGKQVLLTQFALRYFAGSEIVVLELAEFLQAAGAEVVVFAWYLGEPLKSEFLSRGIYITDDDFDPAITGADFSLVWANHQVMPMGLLNRLEATYFASFTPLYADPHGVAPQPLPHWPHFVFYHMSALADNSLEHPYAAGLERQFGALSLFVSEEAQEFAERTFGRTAFNHVAILPNQFPSKFLRTEFALSTSSPQRILVVSNHPPRELGRAQKLLARTSVQMDFIGRESVDYRLITPELLSTYDAIVTIGKTVQYGLAMGIPVYIYDKYGGPGYLSAENFAIVARANFSGRGSATKSPAEIVSELVSGFAAAREFLQAHHAQLIQPYEMSQNLPALLAHLPSFTPPAQLSCTDFNLIALAEAIARKKILAENIVSKRKVRAEAN